MDRFFILLILALLLAVNMQAQNRRDSESQTESAQAWPGRDGRKARSALKRLSREYNNVSLADALRQLSEQQTGYTIMFLYNELEDFRITTSIRHKTLPEAVRQMVGFYPIRVTTSEDEDGRKIFVECMLKTDIRYKGSIIDEKKQPVAYANIALLSPRDSTLITGSVSNESGFFIIPCEQKPVLARISFVGYKTLYQLCNGADLGIIRMQPETQALTEVTVKGQTPILRREAGTIIFDTRYVVGAVNAVDLLRYAPGILLSNDDMTLCGASGVIFCINSREQRMGQKELLQMLKSFPASEIERIEITQTPGATYSAAGNAGVVNFVLKKKDNDFVGGTVGYAHTQSEEHGDEATANVIYNKGRISTSLNIAGTWDNTRYLETNDVLFTDILRHGTDEGRIRKENYSLRWQMDYKASEKLDLGVYVMHADGSRRLSVDGCYDFLPKTTNSVSDITTQTRRKEDTKTWAVNVNASQKLNDKGAKIDYNLDYYRMRMGDERHSFSKSTYTENSIAETFQSDTADFNYQNRITLDVDNYSAKADLSYAGFKCGMQYAYTRSHRDLGYTGVGGYSLVSNTYDEQLWTGYMEYGRKFGHAWSADVGGRYEHIWTKVVNQPMANAGKTDYGRLFPSFHVGFKPNLSHTFNLSLSSRITRPNIINLNSDWVWKDVNHVSYGNQNLKPSYLYKATMGYTYKGVLSFDLYYAYQPDRIDEVYMVDKYVTYNSWDNFTDEYDFGVNSFYFFDKLSWMKATLMQGIGQGKTAAGIVRMYMHPHVENIAYTGVLQLSFFFDARHRWTALLNATYSSPEKDVTRSLHARYMVDAGLQYRFWKDRLSLGLTCRNLIASRIKGTEYFDNKFNYRLFRLTLSYNWGARLRHHQHRYESDTMQERIVNDF